MAANPLLMMTFFRRPLVVVLTLLLLNAVLLARRAEAKPDFAASELSPERGTVVAGETAVFTLTLRNQGDEAANGVEVRLASPETGYLLEVTGLEGGALHPEDGSFAGQITLPVQAEKVVQITVLAPREAAGKLLGLSVRVADFNTMTEEWRHGRMEIESRPFTGGWLIGGLRVTTAGLMSLGWLVATAVVVLLASVLKRQGRAGRFFGPGAGALAVMIAVAFWLIFAAMAWHDYRVLTQWKPTTGTIVGRRVTLQSVSSQQRLSSGASSLTKNSEVAKPEFAVRYLVEGREVIGTGYDTGSSLRVGGGRAQLEKEFEAWRVGAEVPCWYDPEEPASVVLKRGFGGAYLFALLPLLPFWIGCRILW